MDTSGEVFQILLDLSQQHGIQFYFVPVYYREGEFAPSLPNERLHETLAPYDAFQVIGHNDSYSGSA